jgi:pimeloyl-ACP methyl ester carboxylesterase
VWRRGAALTSSQPRPDRPDAQGREGRFARVSTPAGQFEEWQIALHGRRAVYRIAGSGPPVVLIHGMLNSSSHWQSVALELARDHTVIAPDLIGHGDSAAPRGDYSLGAHAASIRDLIAAIGIERATIVGHSLGGGVAMQFFYQFPQRVERLVLISSGGLGREVSPMLRTAALPGVSALLSLTIQPRLLAALAGAGRRMRVHGQRVSATDRLYLLETMPTMIVWGERDNTIPLAHGRRAHEAIPHSYFRTLAGVAHFPHLEDPQALALLLREFIAETSAGQIEDADWGAVLARRSPRERRLSDAAA